MATISIDEFSKLDLRVAKIIEASRIEGSDKLLRLLVRIGPETRTLVAGIAEHYSNDELLGRKIIIVANLEPRTLRGVESQGMLLAAQSEDGRLALLALDGDVPDGSSIH